MIRASKRLAIGLAVTSTALDRTHQPAVVSVPAMGTRLMEEEGIHPPFA